MISRSVPPSARTTYAIRVASGDHAGVASAAGVSVTCRRSLPSMDIVQTSPSWMYARRVPSGETAGLVLAPSVVSRTSLEPSGSSSRCEGCRPGRCGRRSCRPRGVGRLRRRRHEADAAGEDEERHGNGGRREEERVRILLTPSARTWSRWSPGRRRVRDLRDELRLDPLAIKGLAPLLRHPDLDRGRRRTGHLVGGLAEDHPLARDASAHRKARGRAHRAGHRFHRHLAAVLSSFTTGATVAATLASAGTGDGGMIGGRVLAGATGT